MAGVLVWAETQDNKIKKITFEAANVALNIAEKQNIPSAAVIFNNKDLIPDLAKLGFGKIYHLENEHFNNYSSEVYTEATAAVGREMTANIYITGATALGRDLSARLAARLDAALAADVIEIMADQDPIKVIRPVYSGKLIAGLELLADSKVISIRPNVFPVASETDSNTEITAFDPGKVKILTKVKEAIKSAQQELDVTEATIIVSGGRGLGGSEGFDVIKEFAQSLNAAVGASRVAVDEGWIPYKHQVGQTGKVVSPVLYIACGISGAIQHFAGMGSAKFILAINKDKEAPIMQKADFAIVGDLFQVIPILKQEILKVKGQ